jgi:hypothetical protein
MLRAMNAGLRDALLRSARANAEVNRQYAALGYDPGVKYFTYALLLQNNKVYVGTTRNIYDRLDAHFSMSRSASLWVKAHGPPVRVLEIVQGCGKDDEKYKTLEMMEMFGWENVRGAGWCRVEMRAPPGDLATFERDRLFDYLPSSEIAEIVRAVEDLRELRGDPPESQVPQPPRPGLRSAGAYVA